MNATTELAELRAENEQLREHIHYLEGLLKKGTDAIPPEWRLTGIEAKIYLALARGGLVSKEQILESAYYDRADDPPEIKIVDVFICKLRKKLKPYGVQITTIWGVGYRLEQAQADGGQQQEGLSA